jgi:uncharacterized protein (DUF927 family)
VAFQSAARTARALRVRPPAARPDAAVVVCEGEKAADAAGALFPDLVAVASMNGAKAARAADWAPLRGRQVTICPDRDAPGSAYAVDVTALLQKVGAASVRVVDVPPTWPEGWDLSDALPDGVEAALLHEMLRTAPILDFGKLPPGFFMMANGLHFVPAPTSQNSEPQPIFVTAPFEIIGEANDGAGGEWGLVLRWKDRDNVSHDRSVQKRLVHGTGNDIAAYLEDNGLTCGESAIAHELLKRFVRSVQTQVRLTCVDHPGWHRVDGGHVFVIPGEPAIGPGGDRVMLQGDRIGNANSFTSAGTLKDWQDEVARYAIGNPLVAINILAQLAGPLLDVVDEPSGGIHLHGRSQTGKTSAQRCGASVWGRGNEQGRVRNWRATANGLEGIAAEACDTGLCLDEMGQIEARELAATTYMLANQIGKQRAGRDGSAKACKSWRLTIISSGEVSVEAKLSEGGQKIKAGQDVRLISIPTDDIGILLNLHGKPCGGVLADHLRRASCSFYGTAGRAFVAKLVEQREEKPETLAETIREARDDFIVRYLPEGADGQARSVCGRFGLFAAAGELATECSILPWPSGEATAAAATCFDAWIAARGGAGSKEEITAVQHVRAFIEAHGTSRFEEICKGISHKQYDDATGKSDEATQRTFDDGFSKIGTPIEPRTVNRAGFRRWSEAGWQYFILPEAFKNEVCKGQDYTQIATTLRDQGLLTPDKDGKHLAKKERIPNHGTIRVFAIGPGILGADHG